MDVKETPTALEEIQERPPRRRIGGKKRALILGGCTAGVLIAAYAALCAVAAGSTTVQKGTTVLGLDVGGCTREQVEELWRSRGDEICRETAIDVTTGGETVGSVSLADLAVQVTPEDAAEAAWHVGRGSGFLDGGWAYLKGLLTHADVIPAMHVEKKQFSEALEGLDQILKCTAVDGAYRLDENKTDGFS